MKRLALTAALAALSVALPAHAAPRPHARPDRASSLPPRSLARPPVTTQTPAGPVTELTLANGLTVILQEEHASPVVAFDVTYRVGARNETLGATGSAHLLEHMMFKGTKTLGKGQIAQLLGRNGASYNASTWPDYTNFFETYASDRLELGFTVEASRMRDALILDAERQSEMTVVRNELEGDENDAANMLYQEITELAFKAHPYHHPTIGYRSDVEGVSTAQLRRFYDTYYQPNNAVAVLVGDFTTAHAIALAHRYFDALPAGPTPPLLYTTEEPQIGERRVVLRRRGDTNMLQVAFHIPQVASRDLAPLFVLDAALTNGLASRLHQALVEAEEASQVWSEVGLQRDSSLYRVGAVLKPSHDGQTDHAAVEAAMWRALDSLRTSLLSPEELERARRQTLATYAFANEGVEATAQELGSFAVRDRWQRSYELQGQIQRVSALDVNRVVKAYLTRDNATTGWYVSTPDGPTLKPPEAQAASKPAVSARVAPAPLFDFERHSEPPARVRLPERRILANGLVVWLLPVPGSRTVAFDGQLLAGSALDPADKGGVAEAVANLMDVGSRSHDKFGLAKELEDVGASLDFEAGPVTTALAGQCLPEDTPRVIKALAERLREPTFPELELEKFAYNWKNSLAENENDPGTRAGRAFARLIYPPDHPLYQVTPAEAATQIDRIKSADLLAYHQAYYGPNVTTLVLVGNLDPDATFKQLDEAFAGWAPVKPGNPVLPAALPPKPGLVTVDLAGGSNVQIVLGHAGVVRRTDPRYFAFALANDILGGDAWASRLGAKLRDELGLTYGAYAELDAGLIPGAWDASASVNPANVKAAVAAMREVLARFVHDGVTDDELAYAKRAFVGSQAHLLATNSGMARAIARMALFGLGEDYWVRYPRLVNQVTRDEVNQALREMIRLDALDLVVVGPHATEEAGASAPAVPGGSR